MREGERLEKQWRDENVWREKGWKSVNVKLKKKYIKNSYKKMERKKIMMWMLMWLNVSTAVLNVTFQFLVIYR